MTFDFVWDNFIFMSIVILAEGVHLFHSKRRKFFVVRLALCLVICLCAARAVPIASNGGAWGILFNYASKLLLFAMTVCSSAICFKNSLFYMFNRCMFGYATCCCSYIWGITVISLFDLSEHVRTLVFSLIFILSFGIFCLFAFIKHKIRPIKLSHRAKTLIIMFTLALSFGLVFIPVTRDGVLYLRIPTSFALAYLGLFFLITYTSEKHLKDDNQALQQILEKDRMRYEISKEYIDIINVKCHDLKHQLRGIRQSDKEISDKVLDEIEQAVSIYDADIKTGSKALDVVLAEKIRSCAIRGIEVSCIADGALLSFIQPTDLYSLIGNMLDNAIEAVETLSDKEKRVIGLIISRESGLIRIRAENYFEGSRAIEGGLPATTKGDKYNHGFGTKSIRMIAEKYGGSAVFSTDHNIFTVNILIPFPADNVQTGVE